jgi:cell division protein FtsW
MMTPENQSNISLKNILLGVVVVMTILGLIMVYAASAMKGHQQINDSFYFFRKQAFAALAGFAAIYFIGKVRLELIEKLALPLTILAIGLLALIFVPGLYKTTGGATRWLNLAGFRFQPSELAKLALVLFLAKNLTRPSADILSIRSGVLPNIAIFGIFAALLMKQPDFGTTVLLGMVTISLLFIAGLRWSYIASAMTVGVVGLVAAIWVAPYRLARLTSFLDPWGQIKTGGFQIIQSFLAFRNGAGLGVGLGESKQKLYFLPEAHTDFILAVLGEELGVAGVVLVCLLFFLYCFIGFQIAFRQTTDFRRVLATGLTLLIGYQSCINMGVAMGMLPTKGIPLPFLSSGATSMLTSLVASALLLRLAQDLKPQPSSV